MESIRGSSVRVAVSRSNDEGPLKEGKTIGCIQSRAVTYDFNFSTGTHCLIEWNEPNSPVSVVERKNVKSVGGVSEPNVGDVCSIRCRERGKWIEYPGKLLAQGSKKEMELELARLDNLESSSDEDDEDEEDARAGLQVKGGAAKEDARAGPQVKGGAAKEDARAGPQVKGGAAKDDGNIGKTKDGDARQEGTDLNSNGSAKGDIWKQQSVKRKRQTVSCTVLV